MKIKLIEKEITNSNETVFLKFEGNNIPSFKEGQFMMLSETINGDIIKRAYSIATTNNQGQNNQIGFIVKKASENGMSNYLVNTIDIGDEIEIMGPFGHMNISEHSESNNYILISVGSGLGPIYSIYKNLVDENNQYNKIVNIFGERYFGNCLDSVNSDFGTNNDKIKNICYLSRESKLPNGFHKGYVQQGISDAVAFAGTNAKVFLCGLPAMVDESVEKLIELGVPQENIKFEKY